jgi:hypothetical protein
VWELTDRYNADVLDGRKLIAEQLEKFGAPRYNDYPTDEFLVDRTVAKLTVDNATLLAHTPARGIHHSVRTWPSHMSDLELPWSDVWFGLVNRGNTGHTVCGNLHAVLLAAPDQLVIAEYGCKHDYHVSHVGNCYRELTCTVCGHTYGVDSSG